MTPKGRKYWHCRYKRPANGKMTFVSLGVDPELSLSDARLEHQQFLSWQRASIRKRWSR
ncbi:Arm DNA-binding domain-containing protein [Salmonella enterica]|uniref:Arm DNA-binding domain-containing protein n=1 Tax=Salmonella enterica TaxID=28901 RepID=UPI0034A55FFA